MGDASARLLSVVMNRAIILCPLRIEAAAARRAVRAGAEVMCVGPGAVAVREAVRRAAQSGAERLVLFGVAGGLSVASGAPALACVIDEQGNRWECAGVRGAVVLGVNQPLWSPDEKRRARSRFGADVVDCESHAFAAACRDAGIAWRIVRGISDGPGHALPRQAGGWIRRDGATRYWRVAADLVARPSMIGEVRALGKRTRAALQAASARLVEVLAEEQFAVAVRNKGAAA